MKKIYSVIMLMFSLCVAGFADEARLFAAKLANGTSQGNSGTQGVVIESVNPLGSVHEKNTERIVNSVKCVDYSMSASCSIGWISSNNLRASTQNNPGASPDAGFLLHTQNDEHSTFIIANSNSAGKSTCRFFSFVVSNAVYSLNANHLSSHISSPFKFRTYV